MSESPTEFLTVNEAAEILRVSRDTVFSLIRSGKLPAFKVGKQFRIRRDTINNISTQPFTEGE